MSKRPKQAFSLPTEALHRPSSELAAHSLDAEPLEAEKPKADAEPEAASFLDAEPRASHE